MELTNTVSVADNTNNICSTSKCIRHKPLGVSDAEIEEYVIKETADGIPVVGHELAVRFSVSLARVSLVLKCLADDGEVHRLYRRDLRHCKGGVWVKGKGPAFGRGSCSVPKRLRVTRWRGDTCKIPLLEALFHRRFAQTALAQLEAPYAKPFVCVALQGFGV